MIIQGASKFAGKAIPAEYYWGWSTFQEIFTSALNAPVEPSAFDQIIDQLQTQLQGITTLQGFNNDIGEVNKEMVSQENIREFPAINILVGPETYLGHTGSNEAGRLMKTLTIILDVYIQEKEDKQQKMADLLADIELVLYDDTIGNNRYNLNGKCLVMQPIQTQPLDTEHTSSICGFIHELQIKYRQKRSDPKVLYN